MTIGELRRALESIPRVGDEREVWLFADGRAVRVEGMELDSCGDFGRSQIVLWIVEDVPSDHCNRVFPPPTEGV